MANLWKDGDVITAEKLNRIAFTRMVNDQTGELDITPADIFDENNVPIVYMLILYMCQDNIVSITISRDIEYDSLSGKYLLHTANLIDFNTIDFESSSRTQAFATAKPSD